MARKTKKTVEAPAVTVEAPTEFTVTTEVADWPIPLDETPAVVEEELVAPEMADEPEVAVEEVVEELVAPEVVAVPNVVWPTIQKYAEHLIQTTDLKNPEIAKLIKLVFPTANTSVASVAWYRSNLKKPVNRTRKPKVLPVQHQDGSNYW